MQGKRRRNCSLLFKGTGDAAVALVRWPHRFHCARCCCCSPRLGQSEQLRAAVQRCLRCCRSAASMVQLCLMLLYLQEQPGQLRWVATWQSSQNEHSVKAARTHPATAAPARALEHPARSNHKAADRLQGRGAATELPVRRLFNGAHATSQRDSGLHSCNTRQRKKPAEPCSRLRFCHAKRACSTCT